MMRPFHRLLLTGLLATPLVAAGCGSYYDEYYGYRHPPYRSVEVTRTYYRPTTAPATPSDPSIHIPMPSADAGAPNDPQALAAPQLPDSTGVMFTELPSVKHAIEKAGSWPDAEKQMADRIDGPDLRQHLHEGMTALAPRVARGLIAFKGDVAVVTVAVYKDNAPATQPSTQPAAPATQPVYRDAAIALAFEGFGHRLDATFLPRVLADQPRSPEDGRQPVDPNLSLDKDATSYIIYRLTPDGLVAGVVAHNDLRRELADAVDHGPTTRPTAPQTQPGGIATEIAPAPPLAGGAMIPDYSTERVVVEEHNTYWYGNYWGPAYDPYLYDLYGCRWGYGGFYAGGYIYGGGPWYYHHHHGWNDHWHDGHHDHDGHHGGTVSGNNNGNGNPRGGIVRPGSGTNIGSGAVANRGTVPWLRPPIVSPVNPTVAASDSGNAGRGGIRNLPATATPRMIPATAAPNGSATGSSARNSPNSPAGSAMQYKPRGGPTVTYVPNTPADVKGDGDSKSDGQAINAGQAPRMIGPRQYVPSSPPPPNIRTPARPDPSVGRSNPSVNRGSATGSGNSGGRSSGTASPGGSRGGGGGSSNSGGGGGKGR